MKKPIIMTFLFVAAFVAAQVGIETDTPKAVLHVNGDLQLTNALHVGGTATTLGNAGTSGRILTSRGPNNPPAWTSMTEAEIPFFVNASSQTSASISYSSGTWNKANFNAVNYIDSEYISYNTTNREFIVLVTGFYEINASISVEQTASYSDTKIADTAIIFGTSTSNILARSTTSIKYSSGYYHHNMSTSTRLTAGQKISLQTRFGSSYKISRAGISFLYISQ